MLIDRENLRAAGWAWLYCAGLVMGGGLLEALGFTGVLIAPFAIVVLPLLVTLPFVSWRRRKASEDDA